MTDHSPDPVAAEPPGWEPVPPGFMDRPEVKEAVEWALAQVGKKSSRPGMSVAEIEKLADEQRRELDPPA